jgi:hypothetical protein
VKDLAVGSQGLNTLLYTGAAGVVKAYYWCTNSYCMIHYFADLLCIGLSQSSAHNSKVLTEYEDLTSGNGAMASYNSVSRILTDPGPAGHEQIEFLKGIIIKKQKYALACRELPLFVLDLYSFSSFIFSSFLKLS